MRAAPDAQEPPRQLWLDVDRPLHMRPRRHPAARDIKRADSGHPVIQQMEMRMTGPTPRVAKAAPPKVHREPVPTPAPERPFGSWLLDQAKRPGSIGELAKAAKLDRQFPRAGTADAVRARFSAAGADGDAFEALDDAEREYDRIR